MYYKLYSEAPGFQNLEYFSLVLWIRIRILNTDPDPHMYEDKIGKKVSDLRYKFTIQRLN